MTGATALMPVGRRQPRVAGTQMIVASAGVVLSLTVALGGGPSSLDSDARQTLAITVLGLALWGAFPQQAFWPSVLVIGLVLVSRTMASPSTVAGQVIGLYGTSGVWTPLTGFVLAHAVAVSGLGRRLAFAVVRHIGRRPSLVLLAIGIVSVLIAPLSPSTTAKAFLLLPICVGLAEAYGVKHLLARTSAPASRAEVATALALGLVLLLWVSEPLTGLNGGLLGLIVTAGLFLPPVRAIRVGGLGEAVPWGPVALFFAALLLGSAITQTAAFDPIVRSVFEALGIGSLPLLPAVGVVVVIALFGHLVFTSTTAYATVIVPIAIAMAAAGGLPPATLALPVAITIGYAFMLPMNTVPNLIMLDADYFSARQMLGYGTILTVAAAVILLLIALPYWQMLGVFAG